MLYLFKYALTQGIRTISCYESVGDGMIKVGYGYYHKDKEYSESLEEAKAKAEVIRLNRIASLKRSLAKFEKMKF